jgi:hypothetical protein
MARTAILPASPVLCLLALGACSDKTARPAAGGGLALGGEVAVTGLGEAGDLGTLTLSVTEAGSDAPFLARSWELADPLWRARGGERRLYFRLDRRDLVGEPPAGATWELAARWDPDGNPLTEEPGAASARLVVRGGDLDLVLELPTSPTLAGGAEPPREPGGG